MFQQITIVGNLGKDPEMRFTDSGTAVCSFSVAASRKYTRNDETVEETVWFRVSVWGKMAEVCNTYLKKGSKVLILGRLTPDKATGGPRVYEANGEHRASFEVNAQEVRFLSKVEAKAETQEDEFPF